MARSLLLDMDPGVDDALGLLLAARSPEVTIEAVTICGGNAGLDRCALNALKTLRIASADPVPPVALGAARPLRRSPFRAPGIHGADGLGDTRDAYPDPARSDLDPRPAAEVIVETARVLPEGSLTLVATGPLTNVAEAISLDPGAMRRLGGILWMGGAYGGPGNITALAEFNAFCDPDAAREVMDFGAPVRAVGLEACMKCPLHRSDLARLPHDSPTAAFARAICAGYMDFYQRGEGFDGCYLHDPLAVGLAIWPELATQAERHHVRVITEPGDAWGMTVVDRRPRNPWMNAVSQAAYARLDGDTARALQDFDLLKAPPRVEVVLDVDASAFLHRFLERLI
jgi:purine nucleosidase/pyrimidine-specific ribonucleoside hydrolase